MPEKTLFFPDTKKDRFFAQSSGSRGQPKKHSEKHNHEEEKCNKMYSKKFPKKITFFWNFSEQQLWPGRKNVIFSHKEDSQNIVEKRRKNGENSTPSAMGETAWWE